jgi:hypothetical protein
MARSVRPALVAVLAMAVFVTLVAAGCSGRSAATPSTTAATPSPSVASWRAQAQQLLAQHGLQSAGELRQAGRGRLRSGEMWFELVAAASRSVGLDLAAHAGQRARWFTVPLRASDPAGPVPDSYGPVSAIFVVRGGELIGAAGSMNADPGIVTFDYLSQR